MRPRDLIQLCNICRDKASYRGENIITQQSIKEAIPQYSTWKLEDLMNEYTVQYPFLESLVVGLFYSHSSHRFSRDEFNALFKPIQTEFIEKYGKIYFEPIDALHRFCMVGFMGSQ
jgi:hypothetical protein